MTPVERDLAEARRELAESRRIWQEKREDLEAFTEQLVGTNGNLQRLVESAKAVGCVVYTDGHQRFRNERAEQARAAALEEAAVAMLSIEIWIDAPVELFQFARKAAVRLRALAKKAQADVASARQPTGGTA